MKRYILLFLCNVSIATYCGLFFSKDSKKEENFNSDKKTPTQAVNLFNIEAQARYDQVHFNFGCRENNKK